MNYQYRKAPNPTEFSLFTGVGTTALDQATLAKDVPCQAACPARTDVPAYIAALADNDPEKAYRINQEDNVFPAVLGRTCSRPCEDACRHNWTNVQGPVHICHLKRSGADRGAASAGPLPAWFEPSGKRIAIVGGGPTGLTAARQLYRYGHAVTLFEREDHLGGMMLDGIPRFRLPKAEVEREIALITDAHDGPGIEVRLGQTIDAAGFARLVDTYDAVLTATGTVKAKDAGITLAPGASVFPGLTFMKDYNDGKITHLEGDVVVIGGGFTAVDCARACARAAQRLLGKEHRVSIAYRRGERHMSADLTELEDLRAEGIDVRSLLTPVRANTEAGRLVSVTFVRNRLVAGSNAGKPKFEPIPDSEFDLPCRHLIVAVGQDADLSLLPAGVTLGSDQRTTHPKVFAAGDFLTGSVDVIHAVAEGKAAADHIDRFLTGRTRVKHHVAVELIVNEAQTGRTRDHDLVEPRPMPLAPLAARIDPAVELERGYDDALLAEHAGRCYQCNHKFEIDADKCIQCNWCIDVAPRNCIKRVSQVFRDENGVPTGVVEANTAAAATFIYIDSDECIRCGRCLRVCPTQAISLRKMERVPCAAADLVNLKAPTLEVAVAPRGIGGAEKVPGRSRPAFPTTVFGEELTPLQRWQTIKVKRG
jgi:formate dehydrogenase major subunit